MFDCGRREEVPQRAVLRNRMVSSPFDPFLIANGFVVFDGGLATELEAQGADLAGDLWSAALLADNPSLIRDTHLAYYRAGADVAISASYQASFEGFLRKGFCRERAEELLLLSVKLAVEARDLFWTEHQNDLNATPAAADAAASVEPVSVISDAPETVTPEKPPRSTLTTTPSMTATSTTMTTATTTTAIITPRAETNNAEDQPPLRSFHRVEDRRRRRLRPLVAGSLGCYGAALADGSEYRGDYGDTAAVTQDCLRDFHAERLDVLTRANGVDLVVFETVPCLAEVRAILSLLQDFRPTVSAVVSVSCKDGQHLRSGERVEDFADLIWQRDTEGEVQEVAPACVVGVGVNCTAPIHVADVLRTLSEAARTLLPSRYRSSSSSGSSSSSSSSGDGGGGDTSRHASQRESKQASSLPPPLPPPSSDQAIFRNSESVPPATRHRAHRASLGRSRIALVAYPNSGEEWDACARDWVEGTGLQGMEGGSSDEGAGGPGEGEGVRALGRMVREWYAVGERARVFGGCCRTRPAHIAEIRRALACAVEETRDEEGG